MQTVMKLDQSVVKRLHITPESQIFAMLGILMSAEAMKQGIELEFGAWMITAEQTYIPVTSTAPDDQDLLIPILDAAMQEWNIRGISFEKREAGGMLENIQPPYYDGSGLESRYN
jgi:hypothetical protein